MQIQKVPLEYLSQVNVQVFSHALQDFNNLAQIFNYCEDFV